MGGKKSTGAEGNEENVKKNIEKRKKKRKKILVESVNGKEILDMTLWDVSEDGLAISSSGHR